MGQGFGWKFDVCYCLGMIVLIFGLFNVITSIFVEATMAGLKYNEVKQKLASMYQSQYVETNLRRFVKRARHINAHPPHLAPSGSRISILSKQRQDAADDSADQDVCLSE